MGLLRSGSQLGARETKGRNTLRKDPAGSERKTNNTPTSDARQQKSTTSQERPRTAHSQQERPKTADRQQTVDRRRSFSRPRTATSATSGLKSKDKDKETNPADMAAPPQTIEFKAGNDVFNFPTPSPRLPPPVGSATLQPSPARAPFGASLEFSPKIGMAIGSPGQMPPQWGRSHTTEQIGKQLPARPLQTRAMTGLPHAAEGVAEKMPKKKASWKNFGGMFGRKPSTKTIPSEPVPKLQSPLEQDESIPAARTLHSAARQMASSPAPSPDSGRNPAPAARSHKRTPSMTRGMARLEARAQADRAAFMERGPNDNPQATKPLRTPSMIQKEGFSPTFGPGAPRTSEELFKSLDTAGQRNDSPLSVAGGPGLLKLDLDIPDHHMERYSVMFEKFLDNGERRPSIIERRQSKLQRKRSLKRLDEMGGTDSMETPALPQRSVTSPHLSSIPSLSVKTGKKVRSPESSPAGDVELPVTAVHRPHAPKRANTTPSKAASPVKHNFSKPRMVVVPTASAGGSTALRPAHARGTSMYSENSLPPTPRTASVSTEHLPEPTLAPAAAPLVKHAADHDNSPEAWEMLSSSGAGTPSPRTRSQPRPDPDPYRRVKSPEDLESRIVQVSVARQVSVSKARNTVRRAVDAKQPLRPRVVELSKNRKSTVVLIEGGDDSGS